MSDTLHLILVDDNPDDRAVVMRELGREFPGLKVLQILDHNSLTKALTEGPCDVVITDDRLPWASGWEILQAVKKVAPTCPVIMFTRMGSREAALAAIRAGFDDYVVKPPQPLAHLPSAVRSAVQKACQRHVVQDAQGGHYGGDALPACAKGATIGEVLADIAYALNTPLSSILDYAAILRQELADTPYGEQVDKIMRAGERCARIVKDILASAPQESPERSAVQVNQALSEARILVVDDEPGIAGVLAEVLQLDGHVVEMVDNGEAALEKLAAGKYDLIITDVHMPDLDGIALYREVERRHPTLVRQFIFLTGDIMSPETLQFLTQTAVPCLSKPFTLEMVRAVVQRVVNASCQVTGDRA